MGFTIQELEKMKEYLWDISNDDLTIEGDWVVAGPWKKGMLDVIENILGDSDSSELETIKEEMIEKGRW